jgi:enoyl-CoA hydratase
MELVLTGNTFTAAEASSWGLISRVVEQGSVVDEAVKVAGSIAKKGRVAVQSAKEGVNAGQSVFDGRRTETDVGMGASSVRTEFERGAACREEVVPSAIRYCEDLFLC